MLCISLNFLENENTDVLISALAIPSWYPFHFCELEEYIQTSAYPSDSVLYFLWYQMH